MEVALRRKCADRARKRLCLTAEVLMEVALRHYQVSQAETIADLTAVVLVEAALRLFAQALTQISTATYRRGSGGCCIATDSSNCLNISR